MITNRQINGPIVLRNTLDWFKESTQDLADYRSLVGQEYTMRVFVKAVVELKGYTGGTLIGSNVNKNGDPAVDNRTVVSLHFSISNNIYYLNYSASPNVVGCADLSYFFDIPSVQYNEFLTLTLDGINSQIYEPRDPTSLAWLDTSPSGSFRDPQYVALNITPLDALRANSTGFSFSGFVDNVRKGGQR